VSNDKISKEELIAAPNREKEECGVTEKKPSTTKEKAKEPAHETERCPEKSGKHLRPDDIFEQRT